MEVTLSGQEVARLHMKRKTLTLGGQIINYETWQNEADGVHYYFRFDRTIDNWADFRTQFHAPTRTRTFYLVRTFCFR